MSTDSTSHDGHGRAVRLISGFILVASMTTSYAATRVWLSQAPPDGPAVSDAEDLVSGDSPVNPFASANGTHLIAFVFTASDCGWSTFPEGMEAIRSLRRQIRSEHGNSYAQISVVGVALDADPDAGLQFLLDLSGGTPSRAFDQISAGGSWLNEQAVRLFWRKQAAVAVIPQVVVIERRVDTGSYLSDAEIRVQDDRSSHRLKRLARQHLCA